MGLFVNFKQCYIWGMTKLLEHAVATARELSPDMQDDIARLMLAYADDTQNVIALTSEEEASFSLSLAQADRREFASDDQVRTIWAKHGL